jgi:hypothetical protein
MLSELEGESLTDSEATDTPRGTGLEGDRNCSLQNRSLAALTDSDTGSDYGEISGTKSAPTLTLSCFWDALAKNSNCGCFIIIRCGEGAFLHAVNTTASMNWEMIQKSHHATADLIASLREEEAAIDFSDLWVSYGSPSSCTQVLSAELLRKIFERIDSSLSARVQDCILRAELPTCDKEYATSDTEWKKLNVIKQQRSEAACLLPIKKAQHEEAQLALAAVERATSPDELGNTFLGLISKCSSQAIPLSVYGPPGLAAALHLTSTVTDGMNKLHGLVKRLCAAKSLHDAAQDLAFVERSIRTYAITCGMLEESCKRNEKALRFQEAQRRRALIKILMPPSSFDEVSWTTWAKVFVQILDGRSGLVESLVKAGRRDPLAVAAMVIQAWKQKVSVAEQKLLEQRHVMQASIDVFQTDSIDQDGCSGGVRPSRREAKKAFELANARVEAAQYDLREPVRLVKQLHELVSRLVELEQPDCAGVAGYAKEKNEKWTEVGIAFQKVDALSVDDAVSKRQKSVEVACAEQLEAAAAFMAVERDYSNIKDVLRRDWHRKFYRVGNDKKLCGESEVRLWNNFQLPENITTTASASVCDFGRLPQNPRLLPMKNLEALGHALRNQEEFNLIKSAATAILYPTVEDLFAYIVGNGCYSARLTMLQDIQELEAESDDSSPKQRLESGCSDVGQWSIADSALGTIAGAECKLRHQTQQGVCTANRGVKAPSTRCSDSPISVQLISGEDAYAAAVRKDDDERVAKGGVPYPEDPTSDPVDAVRLLYWRLADQAVVRYQRDCYRAQVEGSLALRINEQQWNADIERRRNYELYERAEHAWNIAAGNLKELGRRRKRHCQTDNRAYLLARDQERLCLREVETKKAEWMKGVEQHAKYLAADDKAAAERSFRRNDHEANERWKIIKGMSRDERQAKLFEYYSHCSFDEIDEELELPQIELVWLYRLESNDEAYREELRHSIELRSNTPRSLEALIDAADLKSTCASSHDGDRDLFVKELAAAQSSADKTCSAAKARYSTQATQLAAIAKAQLDQANYLALYKRDVLYRWILLTPEEKADERIKEFMETIKCVSLAFDYAKMADNEEAWKLAGDATRGLSADFERLRNFGNISMEMKKQRRIWTVNNDIASSKYSFALMKRVWEPAVMAMKALTARRIEFCDLKDIKTACEAFDAAYRWTSKMSMQEYRYKNIDVFTTNGVTRFQLTPTELEWPEWPEDAHEARGTLKYLVSRYWHSAAHERKSRWRKETRLSETEKSEKAILNMRHEFKILCWTKKTARNAKELKVRAKIARGTIWEKEEKWAEEIGQNMADLAACILAWFGNSRRSLAMWKYSGSLVSGVR